MKSKKSKLNSLSMEQFTNLLQTSMDFKELIVEFLLAFGWNASHKLPLFAFPEYREEMQQYASPIAQCLYVDYIIKAKEIDLKKTFRAEKECHNFLLFSLTHILALNAWINTGFESICDRFMSNDIYDKSEIREMKYLITQLQELFSIPISFLTDVHSSSIAWKYFQQYFSYCSQYRLCFASFSQIFGIEN